MTPVSRYLLAATAAASLFLSGCGAGFQAGPVSSPIGAIKGRVHGGQPPVSGSHVYILQPSTTAYAGPGIAASTANASTSLLTGTGVLTDSVGGYVTTDPNGFFTITGLYNCTAGLPVYAYALGGNAGGGTNTGIGMMAVLGICPTGGGDLSATVPYVWINEVSTIAAAYSLAAYATDATHIGIGPVGSTATTYSALALTGLQNAALTAGNLVNIGTGTALTAPPHGAGVVPASTINTLANILASCVNATDNAFANCTTLFGGAVGGTNATTPTDTATAAINMAHAPVTNVATLYGLQAGLGAPFLPDLATTPNDLTVTVHYTGGGLAASYYGSEPNTISIDSNGNVWVSNYHTKILSRFTNLGVPVTTTGYTVTTGPYATAIDSNGTCWTANYGSSSLSSVTQSGTVTSSVKPTNLASPTGIAFDGSGNMFLSEGGNIVLSATGAGVYIAKTTAAQNGLAFPDSIAVEPGTAGGVWAPSDGGVDVAYFSNALATIAQYAFPASGDVTVGVAIDANGNAWVGESSTSSSNSLVKVTTAGVGTAYTPGSSNYYIEEYSSVAVDGANTVWVTDQDNGAIDHVDAATGTTLSGSYGLAVPGNTLSGTKANVVLSSEPQAMAIDGSGNVWYNSTSFAYLYEIVGAAAPTITPLVTATINSTQGQRP